MEWEVPYPSPEAYYMYPSSSSSNAGSSNRSRSGSLARHASSTSSSSGSKGVAERVAEAVPQLRRAKVVLYEDGAGGEGDLGLLFTTLQQLPTLVCLEMAVPPDMHPRQLVGLAALTGLTHLKLGWEPEFEEGVSCTGAAAGGCEVVPVAALLRLQHLEVPVSFLASHLLPPLSSCCKGLTCLTVDCSSDEQAGWVAASCAGLHGPQVMQQLTGVGGQLQQVVLQGVAPAAAEAAKQWVRGLVGRGCSVRVCCA
jgi:hypothetical protein